MPDPLPSTSPAAFRIFRKRKASLKPSWKSSLHVLTRRVSRRPGPLEIESAKLPGHVDDFANEVQSRHIACFHGLGRQARGVDTPGRDLGLFKALCAGRMEVPMVERIGYRLDFPIAQSSRRPGQHVQFK